MLHLYIIPVEIGYDMGTNEKQAESGGMCRGGHPDGLKAKEQGVQGGEVGILHICWGPEILGNSTMTAIIAVNKSVMRKLKYLRNNT